MLLITITCPSLLICLEFLYQKLNLIDEGKVLSWGHGEHGQLGHSSVESKKAPAVIEALADERVVYIACGGSTSAAVTGEMIDRYCRVSQNICIYMLNRIIYWFTLLKNAT